MAVKIGMKPPHPGSFIRRSVLPDDLSITAAAEVSRRWPPGFIQPLERKSLAVT